jgi:hypothetical protein
MTFSPPSLLGFSDNHIRVGSLLRVVPPLCRRQVSPENLYFLLSDATMSQRRHQIRMPISPFCTRTISIYRNTFSIRSEAEAKQDTALHLLTPIGCVTSRHARKGPKDSPFPIPVVVWLQDLRDTILIRRHIIKSVDESIHVSPQGGLPFMG